MRLATSVTPYPCATGPGARNKRFLAPQIRYRQRETVLDCCFLWPLIAATIVGAGEVAEAMVNPPTTTRAYFRGRCLAKWPEHIVAANWDSMVFDLGRDPLRRVPMMEPLRGTAESVARLIDESDTPAELLARLGA